MSQGEGEPIGCVTNLSHFMLLFSYRQMERMAFCGKYSLHPSSKRMYTETKNPMDSAESKYTVRAW